MNSAYSRVRTNVIMQYGYVAARYVFPLLTLPYLARVLGPDAYGVRSYIVSMMLFAQTISDFGFNLSGAKQIVKAGGDEKKYSSISSSILMSKSSLLLVMALAIVLVGCHTPITKNHLLDLAIAYCGVCFNTLIPDFLFIGIERMGVITSRYVVSKTIVTVLTFIAVQGPGQLVLTFLIESLGSAVAFGMSWRSAKRDVGVGLCISPAVSAWHAFADAFPFFCSNVSVAAFNSLATMAVGIALGDSKQVAYWSVSVTAINAILSLYNPIANALYPHMVRCHDFPLFKRMLFVGSLGAFIAAGLLYLFSGEIMVLLGGAGYEYGGDVLKSLAPLLFFAYPALLFGSPVLGAFGKDGLLAVSSTSAALLYCGILAITVLSGSFSLTTLAMCRVAAELMLLVFRLLASFTLTGNTSSSW